MTSESESNISPGQVTREGISAEKVLTRRQLYDRVWTTPMRTLAQEFGLSDVGLAKVCRRYEIPRPPVGYWAKVEHGKRVKQPPLIANSELDTTPINFVRQADIQATQPAAAPSIPCDPDVASALEMVKRVLPIEVAEVLEHPHKFVASTERALRQALRSKFRDRQDLIHASWEYRGPSMDVQISEEAIPRAMRIANALLEGAVACGFKVTAVEVEKHCYVRVEVLKEQFAFSIREHVRQVPHVLTIEEKEQVKKYGSALWARKCDYLPRGDFTLVASLANDAYCSESWKDGKRKRLESFVGEILEELPWMVQRVRKQREENLRRQEERRRAEQQRWQEEERRRKEQERVTALFKEIDAWQKVDGIRTYIRAVEEIMRELNLLEDPKVKEWLGWASRVADQLDPLESIRHQFSSPRPTQPR